MEKDQPADLESGTNHTGISHWKLIIDQGVLTDQIRNAHYEGKGTDEEPFAVEWLENDPRNPMTWPTSKKWLAAVTMSFATLAVSFASSAFSGGVRELMVEYHASQTVVTLGLSLFVLGFAVGPLFWAPLSELYGRQVVFFITFGAFSAFNAGCAGAQNIHTLIILRFFAGAFGSSPLTNAGGVVADTFNAKQRGAAMGIFSITPFMGPILGPIVGGFLGQAEGWRWIEGLLTIFGGIIWIAGSLIAPETYAPVLLRKRAERLSKETGKIYRSRLDIDRGRTTFKEIFQASLLRPWILLFREPIVLLLSIYMAVIYGTLYLMFGAYPIVYQRGRGWSTGIGGLPFIGIAIGMFICLAYIIIIDNKRYIRIVEKNGGAAPPEARLPPSIIGGIVLPIGLFWFAWTNSPSIHWLASVAAGIPFGFGMVMLFLSTMNYLIDSYTIFAASVLAASSVLRSLFGAAFPLFTAQMYNNLGIHWASSIPAFLALACLPFPFLFYKYGAAIRLRCKYAAEADAFMKKLRGQAAQEDVAAAAEEDEEDEEEAATDAASHEKDPEKKHTHTASSQHSTDQDEEGPSFQRIRTNQTNRSRVAHTYEENPFDLDRVNTRESFKSHPGKGKKI